MQPNSLGNIYFCFCNYETELIDGKARELAIRLLVRWPAYWPGFAIQAWIASIVLTTSGDSTMSTASMFFFSCASVVAPTMVDPTNNLE
jgi:hypothetical protein